MKKNKQENQTQNVRGSKAGRLMRFFNQTNPLSLRPRDSALRGWGGAWTPVILKSSPGDSNRQFSEEAPTGRQFSRAKINCTESSGSQLCRIIWRAIKFLPSMSQTS